MLIIYDLRVVLSALPTHLGYINESTLCKVGILVLPRVRIELTTPASSGQRSTNELPRLACYLINIYRKVQLVGVPGIEPGLHAPEARVLPVYYTPFRFFLPGGN